MPISLCLVLAVSAAAFRPLDPSPAGFTKDNRERIDTFMRARGIGSAGYDATHKPVAVFDWDNTVFKNDIGDATIFWMLANDRVKQPPKRDWRTSNQHFTDAAAAALNAACDALAEPGQGLPTSKHAGCADAIFAIYTTSKTPAGAPAWLPDSTPTIHEPYAWGAQLQSGYTPAEVRAFAKQTYDAAAAAAIGATQRIGSNAHVVAYARLYAPMRDLFGALRHNGFDVWVVSASSQPLVETMAAEIGLPIDHVIGVRTLLGKDGTLTSRIAGCGTIADGADSVVTYNRGKRCWINKVIFGLAAAAQLERAADPKQRPVFAAGDSDTDLAMVQDASGLKLILNRNHTGVMCNALHAKQWLVQPMFIEPLPLRREPYACSTARDLAGAPFLDETGKPMADVKER